MSPVPTTAAPAPPRPPAPSRTGWWRRNRWALVALPVALVLAVTAAGDRVRTLWWQQDLRRPTTAAPGATVAFQQEIEGVGDVDVRVRLDDVRDATRLPEGLVLPVGARAVQVDLTLEADPDTALVTCSLAVRDAAGTRYDYASIAWGAYQAASPCVPADSPGPWPSAGDLGDAPSHPDGPPRPGTWSVSPVVVVPRDVDVTDVVLWWQMPDHVLLEVPG